MEWSNCKYECRLYWTRNEFVVCWCYSYCSSDFERWIISWESWICWSEKHLKRSSTPRSKECNYQIEKSYIESSNDCQTTMFTIIWKLFPFIWFLLKYINQVIKMDNHNIIEKRLHHYQISPVKHLHKSLKQLWIHKIINQHQVNKVTLMVLRIKKSERLFLYMLIKLLFLPNHSIQYNLLS